MDQMCLYYQTGLHSDLNNIYVAFKGCEQATCPANILQIFGQFSDKLKDAGFSNGLKDFTCFLKYIDHFKISWIICEIYFYKAQKRLVFLSS